jgi:hypothetical protein
MLQAMWNAKTRKFVEPSFWALPDEERNNENIPLKRDRQRVTS